MHHTEYLAFNNYQQLLLIFYFYNNIVKQLFVRHVEHALAYIYLKNTVQKPLLYSKIKLHAITPKKSGI